MSELPFRMLCRKYGAEICYTPMFHSKNFSESKLYRARNFTTCPEDRPLVVQVRTVKFQIVAINPFLQFCANNPDYLLKAALYVQDYADAVDSKFSISNSHPNSVRFSQLRLSTGYCQAGILWILLAGELASDRIAWYLKSSIVDRQINFCVQSQNCIPV